MVIVVAIRPEDEAEEDLVAHTHTDDTRSSPAASPHITTEYRDCANVTGGVGAGSYCSEGLTQTVVMVW